jgi:hypothetical protein
VTEVPTASADAVMALVHQGNSRRRTEGTAANPVSSRSHAVLQVRLRVGRTKELERLGAPTVNVAHLHKTLLRWRRRKQRSRRYNGPRLCTSPTAHNRPKRALVRHGFNAPRVNQLVGGHNIPERGKGGFLVVRCALQRTFVGPGGLRALLR